MDCGKDHPGVKAPFEILEATWLSANVRRLKVHAPRIVKHCGAGQFVIVRATSEGERIPLTIAGVDRAAGSILLIVQEVGATTRRIARLEQGDRLSDVAGPLGRKTELERLGHVVVVGGGVGTAVIYPQACALKEQGNYVSAIIGGRTQSLVILEDELKRVCDEIYPCTDDGSYGLRGMVTDQLRILVSSGTAQVKAVFVAGPVPMMRAVAELTRPFGIHTVASLNPIMVDGTGMCGGCRVHVDGQMKFACVDGPEFDAHQVDFGELADRLAAYRTQERKAIERAECKASHGQRLEV